MSTSGFAPDSGRPPVIRPGVARLRIFPFKSLPGVEVAAAALTRGGGFAGDRAFAIFDETGCVSAKREAKIHALRVRYGTVSNGAAFPSTAFPSTAIASAAFTSTLTGEQFSFALDDDPRALTDALSRHFGRRVEVRHDPDAGFPDDTTAPGPTLISTATLAAVAAWFPEVGIESVRARLRANIEIGDVPPFWEDQLYAGLGASVPFAIGEALLAGTNPCARCIVPSRDPDTGVPLAGFAKRVAERRAASLPDWAEAARFDHFYRLAVNTRPAQEQTGRIIRSGDKLIMLVERA